VVNRNGESTRLHNAAQFASVVWTNAWFEHDIVGGPVGLHFGPGVRDLPLGGSRWLAWFFLAYPHSSYWAVSPHRLVADGSAKMRSVFQQMIRRRPTLLLNLPAQPDDATLRRLVAAIEAEPTAHPSAPAVDVRLNRWERPVREFLGLPIAPRAAPSAPGLDRIAKAADAGASAALIVSGDILARD
jgi:hypothetical protein